MSLMVRCLVQESMPKDTTNITSLHNVHKDCYHKVRNLLAACLHAPKLPCDRHCASDVARVVPNSRHCGLTIKHKHSSQCIFVWSEACTSVSGHALLGELWLKDGKARSLAWL